jgi:FkbM family methyltransferase
MHHAFEANPEVAEVLAKRFRHKSNALVHCEALSSESGVADFYVPLANTGVAGLRVTPTATKEGKIREVRVPVKTLDDYLDDIDACRIVKLDIEGAELLALKGARRLISRDKPLVYFECMNHMDLYKYGAGDICDFFFPMNYSIRDPFSYLGGLSPLSKECFADRVANRRNYNFVATHSEVRQAL